MKQKQITLDFEFNDNSYHQMDFVFPEEDEKQFNEWLLNSLSDQKKNWLLIPADKKMNGKTTLLNIGNITKIDIYDTSHLLKEQNTEQKEGANV
jgi:hypothetical protein